MTVSSITNSENWKALPVPVRMILTAALPMHDLLLGIAETRPAEPEIHLRVAIKLLEDPIVQAVIADFAWAEHLEKLKASLASDLMAELISKLNAAQAAVTAVTPVK